MYVAASSTFEAVYESGITGLIPGVEVAIIDNQGAVTMAPTSVGIAEQVVMGAPTGIYEVTLTAPANDGQFTIVWSSDGSFDPNTVTVEDLAVVLTGGLILPPIGDPAEGVGAGPCSLWANVDAIADCCNLPSTIGSMPEVDPFVLIDALTSALTASSELLYEASGRQYAGACERTVRPCQLDDCMCGVQVLSRGHLVGWDGGCWGGYNCGCQPLSRVKLAGIVRSISEVKIDGIVVNASEYRVDEERWLVRKNGSHWPHCQALDLDDTEPGTFSVSYAYGKTPPTMGQKAATQLACEVYKACSGQECALPTGVTRVTRQGVTIERSFLQRDPNGVWRSGLALVDLFLNTVNPHGIRRRGTFWSPSRQGRYARGAG